MTKHVIAGAGQVGSQLAGLLAGQGHEVVLISRSGSGPDLPGIRRVAADAADRERLTGLTQDAAVLYNCVNPPYHRWAGDWPPLAASLLAAAEATGAGYVILGNLYVYAAPDAPMTEDDPLTPPSVKGGIRVRLWEEALAAHRAGRVRVTEVRASDYFGPGCLDQSHLGDRFVPKLLAGKPVRFVGDPAQPHSWTYVPDVARALAAAGADDRAWGRAWHVPTVDPMTIREVAERLCAIAGVPNPGVRAMPHWLLRAAGVFSTMIGEIEEIRYQFTRPFVVDSTAFRSAFGMEPTPMDEALAETVTWWRGRLAAAA
ncbi:nucleoside-diphosphate-sugar epimerase [Streptosporangium becharense]|uniref:Nucleoside-diphosphate-sugar epimerase n=1 Tax=Streptosporangium becharense TaxID=1816182 RepID=A0A7W9IDG5_9ACTN|nr:NAD-dependent epimerase/dehydratase family protein [Streptosporangium becharense]MBB2912138.1 nucleoside-diphosphate-sugar epimerase [Streptosporangium becharense]MBB5818685.1 nucleoside-diphosphate-sugar epimerase [Streptosporangium becharense]